MDGNRDKKEPLKMKRLLLLTTAALIALAAPGIANAGIQNLSISGNLDGHAYTGELSLDVSGGLAVSGAGTLSILGLNKAPLVLITASTPATRVSADRLASAPTTARTISASTKPSRSAPMACCSTSARPRRSGGSIPCSPFGRTGLATPPHSPAMSAGPSITTCKAARRLAQCRSRPRGRCLASASLASALRAGERAGRTGWL